MTQYALVVRDLRKSYGDKVALRGVSFEVRVGEVFGLIGPNGAGKTTTLRIIATLLKPDAGDAQIYGHSVTKEPDKVRRLIGYLPEEADAYERLTGFENLYFYAMLYTTDREEARRMAEYGAKLSGLGERIWDRVSEYSKGMRRRLLLARTLMVRPKLAILDEPTSGLDVYHAVEVRKVIKQHTRETVTATLLSSHNMLEVEYLCDRIAMINRGTIIVQGTPREVMEMFDAANLEEAYVKAVERFSKNRLKG